MCSRQVRCRSVNCTLGETGGVIRASLREALAIFSSYDTIGPVVWILLPSTTRERHCRLPPVCRMGRDVGQSGRKNGGARGKTCPRNRVGLAKCTHSRGEVFCGP